MGALSDGDGFEEGGYVEEVGFCADGDGGAGGGGAGVVLGSSAEGYGF